MRRGRGESDAKDAAFVDWYQSSSPRLVSAVALAVGSWPLAEEAVAEAYTRAYADWSRVRSMGASEGWIYTVALNQVRAWGRRRTVERRHRDRMRHELPAVETHPRDDEVWKAVASLPERARTAVALRYLLDLPESEVAERMGISRGTVAATLHRARSSLREILRGEAEECAG